MLKINDKKGKFYFSIFSHPVARVLKSELFLKYLYLIDINDSVLDYGSGDGPYKIILKRYFNSYISADYEKTNLKHSIKPDFFIDDCQKINLPDSTFSCVVLSEVLEHIYDPNLALVEINRLLVSDGYVIGTVPFFMWEHEKPHDYYRYTSFSLRQMFELNGFNILKLDYVGDMIGVFAYSLTKVQKGRFLTIT